MMKNIFFPWGPDLLSGYGLLGYNVFAQLARDPDVAPMMGVQMTPALFAAVDTLRQQRLVPAILRSNEYLAQERKRANGRMLFDATVIHPINLAAFKIFDAWGLRNIARCVFEDTAIPDARNQLRIFDSILCASRWNAELVYAATGREAEIIHEGVDISLFCPGPRSQILDADRFYVYSGGKIEYRKSQDIVIRAFSIFAKKHPEAILVSAWHSPYSNLSPNFKGTLDHALQSGSDGKPDLIRWVTENGIKASQFVDLGMMPNVFMPMVLREMDVALQPSRAEACTSLPVKEAMACGVPVIIAANTGMLDLVSEGNCIPLTTQRPVLPYSHIETQGWGESDLEEVINSLEDAFADRFRLQQTGSAGARWISENGRTWQAHAAKLKAYLLRVSA